MGRQQAITFGFLAICTGVIIALVNQTTLAVIGFNPWNVLPLPLEKSAQSLKTQAGDAIQFWEAPAHASQSSTGLPALQSHPLPPSLAQWQDPTNQGDYFLNIKPVSVGYLIWSHFPIKLSIDPTTPATNSKQLNAVQAAIQEWNVYLPIELVESPETADILISLKRPPLQKPVEGQSPRSRSAETRYEFYLQKSSANSQILSHRFTILLNPHQTPAYIQAATRHELGHALGIWGHSPYQTDVLYYSQVRYPPSISPRDINTLKRIYEQPTRLGWDLVSK